jgi:hypothetical protein
MLSEEPQHDEDHDDLVLDKQNIKLHFHVDVSKSVQRKVALSPWDHVMERIDRVRSNFDERVRLKERVGEPLSL